LLITVLRSIRGDFAAEVWASLGLGNQPAIFTQSELWVTLAVVLTNGALVLVEDNRRAFFGGLCLSATGLGVALLALAGYRNGFLPPFAFMVLLGVGMYVPYIAVHTTLFERLIACHRSLQSVPPAVESKCTTSGRGFLMLGRLLLARTSRVFFLWDAAAACSCCFP
jgi:hypothetical protein